MKNFELKQNKKNLIGQTLLLLATLCWGTGFVVLKETINTLPGFFVIGLRFLVSGIILALCFVKRLFKTNKHTLVSGLILGAVLALAYLFQTEGLKHTTPSRNAFLTATYVVLCPFLMWLCFRKKPTLKNVIAAIVCFIGIGLIVFSKDNDSPTNTILGDALTIVSAIFFALQILFIDKFGDKKIEPLALLIIELLFSGVLVLIFSFLYELPRLGIESYAISSQNIFNILYLTLACTLFAQTVQFFGQRLACNPTQSAIILSLESVFGALFSIILGGEQLSPLLIIGFMVVFIGILIGEIKKQKQ